MVVHLWHAAWSYTTHMHSQFLHHTCQSHAHYFVLMPLLHMLTYFQAYCIVAKMASEVEAQSQVPFHNHVLKIHERETLTVHQCSERLKFYGRQLHVVSIQVYNHETSFHISNLVFVSETTWQHLHFIFFLIFCTTV